MTRFSSRSIGQIKQGLKKLRYFNAGLSSGMTPGIAGKNRLQVQYIEALGPATSFATDPSFADALVLYRGSDGDLHPMKINDDFVVVKVVNRYEHFETIPAETYGAVLKQDGEWHPAGADCDAAGTSLIPAELIVAPPESPP